MKNEYDKLSIVLLRCLMEIARNVKSSISCFCRPKLGSFQVLFFGLSWILLCLVMIPTLISHFQHNHFTLVDIIATLRNDKLSFG